MDDDFKPTDDQLRVWVKDRFDINLPPELPPPELIIQCDPPIVFNGKTVSSITFKEPTVAQVEQGDKIITGGTLNMSNMRAYQQTLVIAVSGEPKQIVCQMKISDMNKAFNYLMGFISPPEPTSKNESQT